MYRILIAGAGQIGSRHLQGVKASSLELDIWVYDPSTDSLKVAKERYSQITSLTQKFVHFIGSMNLVPEDIDVAIVASSSKPRCAIVAELLSGHNVKYLILEKFLFPRLSDYDKVSELLRNRNVKAYVNCPRRMFESYSLIESMLDKTVPVKMAHRGKDWGLCCNSIHFIDIFMKLSGSTEYCMDISGIIPEVVESKRNGYVELRGQEIVTTPNGSSLLLSSTLEYDGTPSVHIKNGDRTFVLNESTGEIIVDNIVYHTPVKYQSGLSGILVDSLILTGSCDLTPYEVSSSYHKTFLSTMAPYINKLQGWSSDSCPIT